VSGKGERPSRHASLGSIVDFGVVNGGMLFLGIYTNYILLMIQSIV